MEAFPTIFAVANANNEQILRLWNGLGYNSRALRLKKTCEEIAVIHQGIIPNTYDQLRSLPGIGDYTASAILCFAFRVPIVVVDVNVVRVISRYFSQQMFTTDSLDAKHIREVLTTLIPKNNSSEFFQAIMDIARLYCKKSSPNCSECPLSAKCLSSNQLTFKKVIKRVEPSYLGFPRRIWRGKVLKIVTATSPISLEELLQKLEMSEHSEWILSVIRLLQKDQLIAYTSKDGLISIQS